MTTTAYPTFTRRQRVKTLAFVGPQFAPSWADSATIVGRHPPSAMAPADDHWYVVRWDDGSMLSSHASRLMASNEPAFKGRLPSYRSTQRSAP